MSGNGSEAEWENRVDQQKLLAILEQSLTLQTSNGREDVIKQLHPDIRGNIHERDTSRAHLLHIIKTCQNYPNGLRQLFHALELFEGQEAHAVRQFRNLWVATVMVEFSVNPFGDRGRIDQPERYFVRKRVLRPILHTLKQGQNVSLVGPKLRGKSSLLWHIYQREWKPLGLFSQAVFMPLTRLHNPDQFFPWICEEIGIPHTSFFERHLQKRKLLLCIDQIEEMVLKNFSYDLRAQLRALSEGADAPFTLLIASNMPLDQLFDDNGVHQSPLGGICLRHELPPFTSAELHQFVQGRLTHFQLPPTLFSDSEIDSIWQLTQGEPSHAQTMLKERFDAKQNDAR